MLVGITGRTGSGKNYISAILEKRGWQVMDLDTVCHDLYRRKSDDLIRLFGTTDRATISRMVFDNKNLLRALESVLYPSLSDIVQEASKKASGEGKILAINGSLLKRAALDKSCDLIIYVDAPAETRRIRAMRRDGIAAGKFTARDRAQNDVDYRAVEYSCPVLIVDNTGEHPKGLEDAIREVESAQNAETKRRNKTTIQ